MVGNSQARENHTDDQLVGLLPVSTVQDDSGQLTESDVSERVREPNYCRWKTPTATAGVAMLQ